jgi:hypothetical protein
MPTLLKLFQEIEREETLPDSFCEPSVKLIPKPDKDTTKRKRKKKKNYRLIPLLNIDAKILNKIWQTKFNSISKRSYTMIKLFSS